MGAVIDLHNHSCLSPCGSDDLTPATLAGLGKLAGLQVMALTDHNTAQNCPAFFEAAMAYGLTPVAGMELCTLEEVHVLCLLPTLESALDFDGYVAGHLSPQGNDPAIFGRQLQMDADDHIVTESAAFLAGATDIGVYDVASLVATFGGIAYPAHIDRPAFSLLSNLGLWDEALGFPCAEVSANCDVATLLTRPDLQGLATLRGSDAHYIHQVAQGVQSLSTSPRSIQDFLMKLSQN